MKKNLGLRSEVAPHGVKDAIVAFVVPVERISSQSNKAVWKRFGSVKPEFFRMIARAYGQETLEAAGFTPREIEALREGKSPNCGSDSTNPWMVHHMVPRCASGLLPDANAFGNLVLIRKKTEAELHRIIDPQILSLSPGERKDVMLVRTTLPFSTLTAEEARRQAQGAMQRARSGVEGLEEMEDEPVEGEERVVRTRQARGDPPVEVVAAEASVEKLSKGAAKHIYRTLEARQGALFRELAGDAEALREAGLSETEIALMREGKTPNKAGEALDPWVLALAIPKSVAGRMGDPLDASNVILMRRSAHNVMMEFNEPEWSGLQTGERREVVIFRPEGRVCGADGEAMRAACEGLQREYEAEEMEQAAMGV